MIFLVLSQIRKRTDITEKCWLGRKRSIQTNKQSPNFVSHQTRDDNFELTVFITKTNNIKAHNHKPTTRLYLCNCIALTQESYSNIDTTLMHVLRDFAFDVCKQQICRPAFLSKETDLYNYFWIVL